MRMGVDTLRNLSLPPSLPFEWEDSKGQPDLTPSGQMLLPANEEAPSVSPFYR